METFIFIAKSKDNMEENNIYIILHNNKLRRNFTRTI